MNLQGLKIDPTWTLFLDRDGVINKRIIGGYVKSWEQFHFLPGVLEAMNLFSKVFGRIVVVSNQQGIGKGLMTAAELDALHKKMRSVIMEEGGKLDAVYYCPFMEIEHSILRKPSIGMALQARKMFREIRFKRSLMAGDSLSDMVFGKRAGMKTVFIGGDPAIAKKHHRVIDYHYRDLNAFAHELP